MGVVFADSSPSDAVRSPPGRRYVSLTDVTYGSQARKVCYVRPLPLIDV